MIDRTKGRLFVECDKCGETLENDAGWDFPHFISALKSQGWTMASFAKNSRDWTHSCPECSKGGIANISKLTRGL